MTGVRLTVPSSFTFMVARKGRTVRPGVTLPRARYQTLDEAATEAEAQALASPGQVMIVFQEVLRAKVDPATIDPAAVPRRLVEPGDFRPPRSPGSKGDQS
ncbi:hypothetical protein [Sphingobium yanoikuyae]|uniref:Uncharacterized protein n=1 Tax=Sphingobium yanoikuyae TaxID=13690 RepID=A0A0J9FSC8_SPHYA|nr:hypothetical protein [Sphingobium yanoikuyae]ATP20785.1 hypothetical protein BV87_21990 [Sphingobium yanoikuyae]KMW31135.1 hypothetical protein BV87_02845 [Sphingobium yanoikuyae]